MPYNRETNPKLRQFWKDIKTGKSNSIFSGHPVHANHGENLAKETFESARDKESHSMQEDFSEMRPLLFRIQNDEMEHKEKLEALAIKVVSQLWHIDPAQLTGILTDSPQPETDNDDETSAADNFVRLNPHLKSQIHKRITLNSLTHGAAMHQMQSAHYLVDKEIEKISPQLLKDYTQLSKLNARAYFYFDVLDFGADAKRGQVGSVEIKWENGTPIVIARAMIFPQLIHELVKGAMEILTINALSKLDPETQKHVIEHGDNFFDEQRHMQVGPALWKKFLKAASKLPKNIKIHQVVATLSDLEPDTLHETIIAIIKDPENAAEILKQAIKDSDYIEHDAEKKEEIDYDSILPKEKEEYYGDDDGGTALADDPDFNPDDFDLDSLK